MNNKLINPVTLLFTFLVVGVSLSGCSVLTAGPKTIENAEANSDANKDQGSSKNVNASATQTNQTLWDSRSDIAADPPKFSNAETKVVAKYLFGDDASPNLEIRSRVSGSFTKPNAKQTLYFLSGCKDQETGKFVTDCPHVSWNTEGWIAIYDGKTPVIKINEALGSAIIKVTDVNGDGISEILSIGGYAGMGVDTEGVGIGQISGNKYQDIKGFNTSYSNCADEAAERRNSVASIISYVPTTGSKMPLFSEEYFQAGCEDNPSWKNITKKQFDGYFDDKN